MKETGEGGEIYVNNNKKNYHFMFLRSIADGGWFEPKKEILKLGRLKNKKVKSDSNLKLWGN